MTQGKNGGKEEAEKKCQLQSLKQTNYVEFSISHHMRKCSYNDILLGSKYPSLIHKAVSSMGTGQDRTGRSYIIFGSDAESLLHQILHDIKVLRYDGIMQRRLSRLQ